MVETPRLRRRLESMSTRRIGTEPGGSVTNTFEEEEEEEEDDDDEVSSAEEEEK